MSPDSEVYLNGSHKIKSTRSHSAKGCVIGGCIIPVLFFVFCSVVFNDTGDPLFWPILCVLLGIVGFVIGSGIKNNQP